MRFALLLVVAAVAVSSTGAGAQSPAAPPHPRSDSVAIALPTAEIFAAIMRADTAVLRQRVGDDLRWVLATGGAVIGKTRLLAAAARTSPVVSVTYAIDSLQTWQHTPDVATAEYRLTDRRTFRAYQPTFVSRATDMYVRRRGHWELVRHAQTWLVHSPDTVAVDSAALRPFVGRYDRGAGYIDDVHFANGYLVAQSTLEALLGAPGAHLWPVSINTFSPDGTAPMIVFERDGQGRVTGYVQQAPDGTIARAHRLDPR